ncbi:hypothetical protein D3C72_1947030 [compost metagenome]
MGQSAATPVKQLAFRAVAGGVFLGLNSIEDQRGGALNHAIYRTLSVLFTASCLHKRGIKMLLCHVR